MYIGKRIKEIRKHQRMTLVELSAKSGVQLATLSRIENLKMVGSLESHINIARALGLDVTELYKGLTPTEEKVEVKDKSGATDVFVHSDKSSYEILTSRIRSKRMMPVLLKIEPGGQTNHEKNVPGTEKFIYVLEGKLTAHVGAETYALQKSSSFYFDAATDHYFKNTGTKITKAICVTTPTAL